MIYIPVQSRLPSEEWIWSILKFQVDSQPGERSLKKILKKKPLPPIRLSNDFSRSEVQSLNKSRGEDGMLRELSQRTRLGRVFAKNWKKSNWINVFNSKVPSGPTS
ncbi:uncharacterized protein LOC107270727 [Cephus cinctus]|uniref:Uncharacterized protein LOC107270727 n=1 Tax=Cephus cinctus TaxID=211228 RepID=A0AAJ7W487_CEPCN|nr:uncharacterized protein LOC107270727 [Cephus cinctus]